MEYFPVFIMNISCAKFILYCNIPPNTINSSSILQKNFSTATLQGAKTNITH